MRASKGGWEDGNATSIRYPVDEEHQRMRTSLAGPETYFIKGFAKQEVRSQLNSERKK